MKAIYYFIVTFLLIILNGCEKTQQRFFDYPPIENIKKVEKHFDIDYVNEFHNLENFKKGKIRKWYRQQDSIAENYFSGEKDFQKLYAHYEALENRDGNPESDIKYNESGDIFYLSSRVDNDGKVLYKRKTYNSPAEQLFSSKEYKDGSYEIDYFEPSYNGKYVAIAMGKNASMFKEIIILNIITNKKEGSTISNSKPNKAGGIIWTPDSSSILYIAYPNNVGEENDRNSYTALHQVNTTNGVSRPIFKDGLFGITLNKEYYPVPKIRSEKSNYVFIYAANASDYWDCYYLPIGDFKAGNYKWKLLYSTEDKTLHDWGTERNHIYYFKRTNGENIELCSVDLRQPNFENPNILISGNGECQIASFQVLKDKLYYTLTTNGISEKLYEYKTNGESEEIESPKLAGEIYLDSRSPYKNDLWVTLFGWTINFSEYSLNSKNNFDFIDLGAYPTYPEFDGIVTEVVEVISHDGIKVPLSIIKKSDHSNPDQTKGIITAYGAYGISETPWFHSLILDFVNKGNIYASAHVRGGGEKGPKWHKSGMKSTKENSWRDLIACSEYLIDNGYVNKKKLGLNVNSAGGITGAMAINKRPDLYGAFTAVAPLLNPIRTEYLDDFDNSDMAFEFGTIKELQSYRDLLKMDPVVNLSKELSYPSTLLIIGFKDYLIPPSASGKYIALLQSFNPTNDKPYLLDIDFSREHETNWLDDYAKMLFFTEKELD